MDQQAMREARLRALGQPNGDGRDTEEKSAEVGQASLSGSMARSVVQAYCTCSLLLLPFPCMLDLPVCSIHACVCLNKEVLTIFLLPSPVSTLLPSPSRPQSTGEGGRGVDGR